MVREELRDGTDFGRGWEVLVRIAQSFGRTGRATRGNDSLSSRGWVACNVNEGRWWHTAFSVWNGRSRDVGAQEKTASGALRLAAMPRTAGGPLGAAPRPEMASDREMELAAMNRGKRRDQHPVLESPVSWRVVGTRGSIFESS